MKAAMSVVYSVALLACTQAPAPSAVPAPAAPTSQPAAAQRQPGLTPEQTAARNDSLQNDRTMHVRSEEHTSELQSPCNLVCRLLLEKKKVQIRYERTL